MEDAREKAGLKSWVEEQRLKKWRWAGHAARREDGRWGTRLIEWVPSGKRPKKGRPKARWEDELDDFLCQARGASKGDWRLLAGCREEWEKEGIAFSRAFHQEEDEEEDGEEED